MDRLSGTFRAALHVGVSAALAGCASSPPRPAGDLPGYEEKSAFRLNSVGLVDGARIPDQFACENHEHLGRPPDLAWSGPPPGTGAYAVTMVDVTAGNFVHWALLNLPATVHSVEAGARGDDLPKGTIELSNDFGKVGYGGPCPPEGDAPHAYLFTVYALREPVSGYRSGDRAPRGLDDDLRTKLSIGSASITTSFDR